jgi:DNA-binding LacI/PurR family transcriptional regulator
MARPIIKEVSSVAGLSTQASSRVINKRQDVSPETRKRVQPMTEALGTRPGVLASGWISQRRYTVGIVTAGLEYIGPSRPLKNTPLSNKYNLRPVFQTLLSRQVDGIIWAVPQVGEDPSVIHDAALGITVRLVHVAMAPQKNKSVGTIDHYQGGDWQ